MKGLVISTENKMSVREFTDPLYKSIGEAVGGLIEIVHPRRLKDSYCMVVNEEGLLVGLPINAFGSYLYCSDQHGSPIVGDIVILKEGFVRGERDFVGLEDTEIQTMADDIIKLTHGNIRWAEN